MTIQLGCELVFSFVFCLTPTASSQALLQPLTIKPYFTSYAKVMQGVQFWCTKATAVCRLS